MNEPIQADPIESGSSMFGVSIRAWLAIVIIVTVCLISAFQSWVNYRSGSDVMVTEPLYSMALIALGFYFGVKNKTI